MPLYEVVLEQQYYNQQVVNRWNYVGSGTPASVTGSFALLSALGFISTTDLLPDSTVGGEIQRLQVGQVTFVQATARAIYIDADFYGNPFFSGTVGQTSISGEGLSPTSAFGFRSSRVVQSIGRGFKRFVGVSEGAVDGGGVMSSAALTQMGQLVTAMNAALTYDDEGNTLTFTPCIAQKEKYTTPLGNDAYRYYPTEILQAPHNAVGIRWEAYTTQRTQNSRQYGKGS